MYIKTLVAALIMVAFAATSANSAPIYYAQYFTAGYPEDMPVSVTNAELKFSPPSLRGLPYDWWAPATAGVWAEVIYKFEIPFVIAEAAARLPFSPYFEDEADALSHLNESSEFPLSPKTNLSVSGDGFSYSALTSKDVRVEGIHTYFDISHIVTGSEVIFIRARMWNPPTGSLTDWPAGGATFLEAGNRNPLSYVIAFAVPEPSATALSSTAILFLGNAAFHKRRNRKLRRSGQPT